MLLIFHCSKLHRPFSFCSSCLSCTQVHSQCTPEIISSLQSINCSPVPLLLFFLNISSESFRCSLCMKKKKDIISISNHTKECTELCTGIYICFQAILFLIGYVNSQILTVKTLFHSSLFFALQKHRS